MSDLHEFQSFGKIPRLNRDMVITEKIDGTNAQVSIETIGLDNPAFSGLSEALDDVEEGTPIEDRITYATPVVVSVHDHRGIHLIRAGSRKRWITPGKLTDNYGFAGWVSNHALELVELGEGRHYGEWWGRGIARGYGLDEKRFSLFNTNRWTEENTPACCSVVPVLYEGPFSTVMVHDVVEQLRTEGSVVASGFKNPEGVIVFHTALNAPFKVTCDKDEKPKGQN
jgi:hypothetical protein